MLVDKIADLLRGFYYILLLRQCKARFNPNSFSIKGHVVLDFSPTAEVAIGNNFACYGRSIMDEGKCSKIVVQEGAKLKIGENLSLNNSVIWCSDEIEIGDNVVISSNCMIMDTDFHSLDWRMRMTKDDCLFRKRKKVHIGTDVLFEENVIIGKGIEIGDGVIIKSGSVVTRNIPSNEIWGGNPAIFISKC